MLTPNEVWMELDRYYECPNEASEGAMLRMLAVARRVTVSIEVVTPELAVDWLATNTSNRNVIKAATLEYSSKMERGKWHFQGQPIIFDHEGRLQDGQHRLEAVAQTGVPIVALVVRGLEPAAQDNMDMGRKRTLGHQLTRRQEQNAPTLAAAIGAYYKLITHRLHWSGGLGYMPKMDVDEGLALLAQHPGLRSGASASRSINDHLRLPNGLAAALWYAFDQVDRQDNEVFWEHLKSGEGIGRGDAIYATRESLLDNIKRTPENRWPGTRLAGVIIKGWNFYMKGVPVRNKIKYNPGGASQEKFPLIFGFNGYITERRAQGVRVKTGSESE